MHDAVIVGAGSAGCVLAALRSEDTTTNFLLLGASGARLDAADAHPASFDVMRAA